MALSVSNFFTGLSGFSPSAEAPSASLADAAKDVGNGIKGYIKRKRDGERRDRLLEGFAGMDSELEYLVAQRERLERLLYNMDHGGNAGGLGG